MASWPIVGAGCRRLPSVKLSAMDVARIMPSTSTEAVRIPASASASSPSAELSAGMLVERVPCVRREKAVDTTLTAGNC